MPREIITEWQSNLHTGILSVMYFDTAHPLGAQRTALSNFWGAVDAALDDKTQWMIRNEARELNDATGALEGLASEGVSHVGVGGTPGEPIPDVAQLLFRWHTGNIVNGRFLSGRTFVPGLNAANMLDGNVSQAAATSFAAIGDQLCDSGVGFGVWHRPKEGLGGVFHPAGSCSVWTELATQRKRRK